MFLPGKKWFYMIGYFFEDIFNKFSLCYAICLPFISYGFDSFICVDFIGLTYP